MRTVPLQARWIITWPLAIAFECIVGPLSFIVAPIGAAVASIDESLPGQTATQVYEEPLTAYALVDAHSGKRLGPPPSRAADCDLPVVRLQPACTADHLQLVLDGEQGLAITLPPELRARLVTPTVWRARMLGIEGQQRPAIPWEPPTDRLWIDAGTLLHLCDDGKTWKSYAAPRRDGYEDIALVGGATSWIDQATGKLSSRARTADCWPTPAPVPELWCFDPARARPLNAAELEASWKDRDARDEVAGERFEAALEGLDEERAGAPAGGR